MAYIPLRIDFVEPDTYCTRIGDNGKNHGFPTGTAYILRDDTNGKEYPFGRTCASYVVNDISLLKGLPDFTIRDYSQEEQDAQGNGTGDSKGNTYATVINSEREQAFAKRYLLLRMEKVANIPGIQTGIRYERLASIYANFQQTGQLSDDEVRQIINIEKSEKTPAIYKSNHLLDVYTAYIQLSRRIKRTKPGNYKDMLINILNVHLLQRLTLYPKQISAAKLKLHPQAFKS